MLAKWRLNDIILGKSIKNKQFAYRFKIKIKLNLYFLFHSNFYPPLCDVGFFKIIKYAVHSALVEARIRVKTFYLCFLILLRFC
jgi:hypothetical protein